MRVNGIQTLNFNTTYNTQKTNNTNLLKTESKTDSFVSSTPNFKGVFAVKEKKPMTAQEKKSRQINDDITYIEIMYENAKKEAKEETKEVESLLNHGAVMAGHSFTTRLGKKYTIDKAYEEFTLYTPLYETIDAELKVVKGSPVRRVERRKGQKEYKEVVFDFNKKGYRYTEKIKDYSGKKIRTEKKINMVHINGVGKTTYTERNEDGSFSTYVYRGSGRFSNKFDIFSTEKAVWEKHGENTMNLAEKVS